MRELVFGTMALFVVIYRILFLMVPMIVDGVKTMDIKKIFSSLTLLV